MARRSLPQAQAPRPVLFVLAGVNGAGKSSIGGQVLRDSGLDWFNPDAFARELMAAGAFDQLSANAQAWAEGVRRLDAALVSGQNHAFETTLGGHTIAGKIKAATRTHDVLMWFCGLASPDLYIARVRARVAAGGHDIPEATIRERCPRALANLIGLMPHLTQLQVYDNSLQAAIGADIPDPLLVLGMHHGRLVVPAPHDLDRLLATPEWAKPLVEAALDDRHSQQLVAPPRRQSRRAVR